MTRDQILEARQALVTRLPVTGELLRGSLLERTVRHTSGCTICAGAFLRCLLAQAESRPSAPAWLRPTADAGNTGARRSRRDRADGAQRRRPGSRIVGCRRTGRIDRGDRLQARAAAAAARQAGGLSRPGYRPGPPVSPPPR